MVVGLGVVAKLQEERCARVIILARRSVCAVAQTAAQPCLTASSADFGIVPASTTWSQIIRSSSLTNFRDPASPSTSGEVDMAAASTRR